MKGRDLLVIV